MTETLALVESNTTGNGRALARAARRRGLRPMLLCARPERYDYVRADDVPFVVTDTASVDALVEAVRGLPGPVVGVASTSDHYIGTAAALAAELGLPGPDPESVVTCRDKGRQRRALAAAGVAVPRGITVTDGSRVEAAWHRLGSGPFLVKPVTGSGSVGVRLCADAHEARRHASPLLAESVNERGLAVPVGVLLQEYVSGPEFSVELVGARVVGITAKHLGGLPYFVETGHDFPAVGDPDLLAALRADAVAAVAALGLTGHPAHVELRAGPAGPVVIEVNPRLAGGGIPELVLAATGVDLIDALLDTALGRPAAPPPRHEGAAAVRFLLVPGSGVFAGVDGCAAAARMPGVLRVEVGAVPGTPMTRHGDFRDRVGSVLATAPDTARAAELAERALRTLTVRTRSTASSRSCGSSLSSSSAAAGDGGSV
ncbi:ATP-grasp domain-containing protein [Streptomyces sp. SID3343]|uniref:ATP-grasp domain-containing protein n=1 Tax=Streptomyces sp. SID3343 TaxID=2690260 RepID=UPI001371F19F|nr:ATP-grasp domain-containing protein [Streptomyces sp. SID3343]MYW03145.1 ATP-grasp domain-containing protein [Streptomyces sp. SID3343]